MLSDDQTRILLSMLICIPFSYVIPRIPNVIARQVYSFILGTLIQFYVYGTDIYLIFLMHALVYILVKINPHKCGKHVTVVSLVLLSIYHIYRMIVDYGGWKMDISTIMMSNVNKYSLFAYAYQDGNTDLNKLNKQQIKERMQTLPSFFRFLSYCQFLPSAPISLAFPYKYYDDYIHLQAQYANMPSPWKMVGHDVGYAFILVSIYLIHMFVFPLEVMKAPEFSQQGFWFIVFFSFFCVTSLRFKYYFAWKLSMGAIHASGISYQVHGDGKSDYKLIQTCNPIKVQTTVHVREKIANWNMTCQQWLRKCVYERNHSKNKILSQLTTFMVSAFWHGYYGGYYISFFLWFCQVFTSQLVFKESKKEKSPWMRIYRMAGPAGPALIWVLSNLAFTVSGSFFQILSLRQSFILLRSLYFAPFIFYAVVYIVFNFGATRQRRPKDETSGKKHDKQNTGLPHEAEMHKNISLGQKPCIPLVETKDD